MSNNTLYQTACIACVYTEEGVFSPSCDVLFSADDLASDHLAWDDGSKDSVLF